MAFHNPEYLLGLLVLIPMVYWFLKELHQAR